MKTTKLGNFFLTIRAFKKRSGHLAVWVTALMPIDRYYMLYLAFISAI